MPVTPFHFGPGLLVKALRPRPISFLAFAAANVAVDLEPVCRFLMGVRPLHGSVHTLLVATPLGLAAGAIFSWAFRRLFPRTVAANSTLRDETTLAAAMLGGAMGGASHPLIDGLMHADVQPFWPFLAGNPLLHRISLRAIYGGCVVAGLIGALLLIWRSRPPRMPAEPS